MLFSFPLSGCLLVFLHCNVFSPCFFKFVWVSFFIYIIVRRQECTDVPRRQCTTLTRQECKTVQKPFTTQVPEQKCHDRLEEVCHPIARQKCHTVQDKVDRLVSIFWIFKNVLSFTCV